MLIGNIIAILTILYSAYAVKVKKDLPESLSETSYILKPWMFVCFCNIIGILLMISLMNITEEKYQFIPFVACVGFLFAGNSPLYRKSLSKEVHYAFAILSFISFLVYIIIYDWKCTIPYLIVIVLTWIYKRKNIVFIAEIAAIFLLTMLILES